MNLTCLQKGKFANLTANKVYEGIEDGELYVVVNDIGARARYAKKYFRADPNAVVAAAAPPPPPPRPVTVNLLDVANIEVDVDDDGITIGIGFGQETRRWTRQLEMNDTSISCGINQIHGIIGTGRSLTQHIEALPERIVARDVDALAQRVVNEIIDQLREEAVNAFYVLSDVVEANCPFQNALTSSSVSVQQAVNPNSSNTIALWVLAGTRPE